MSLTESQRRQLEVEDAICAGLLYYEKGDLVHIWAASVPELRIPWQLCTEKEITESIIFHEEFFDAGEGWRFCRGCGYVRLPEDAEFCSVWMPSKQRDDDEEE